MKKLISIILSFAMLAAFPLVSFAVESEEEPVILIYDFDGNLVEDPDLDNLWKYGAVFNEDGTIDESATAAVLASTDYINTTKTLSAGKYWQSYQYQVSSGITIVGTGTCSQNGVSVEMYCAQSVGGERTFEDSATLGATESSYPSCSGNATVYVNFIYRNTSSASRTFKVHIYSK